MKERKRSVLKLSQGFAKRQEQHLLRQGRINATTSSRSAVQWQLSDGMNDASVDELNNEDDGATASVAPSLAFSVTPSLHPSMSGSVVSRACSAISIGAGDDTGYWDYAHRQATKKDLGHNCRECKRPFTKIGEPITERRGARTSSRYHAACFSGFADPRSQSCSSFHVGGLAGTQMSAAPTAKAGSKMRVSRHFDGNSDSRFPRLRVLEQQQGGSLGKIAAFSGNNGFGSRSGKKQQAGALTAAGGAVAFMEHDLSGFEDVLEEKQVLSEEYENEDGVDQPSHASNDGVRERRAASREQRRRTPRGEGSKQNDKEIKPRLNAALLAEHRLLHNA